MNGLYASITGPIFGGAFSSTGVMVIATTSAAALGTAETLNVTQPAQQGAALGTLVPLVGVLCLSGQFKLGRPS